VDRPDINNNSLQVTVEEILSELNQQISSLNFELTVSKIAVKKLQEELAKYVSLPE
jgi:hypothetical protein